MLGAPEDPDAKHPGDLEAEQDDEHPPDLSDPIAVVEKERAGCTEGGPETDMPVTKERHEGKSGNTQGDRNGNSPAVKATTTPIGSFIGPPMSATQIWSRTTDRDARQIGGQHDGGHDAVIPGLLDPVDLPVDLAGLR